jgi:hypothetical protein
MLIARHAIQRISITRFLSYLASYDVASNIPPGPTCERVGEVHVPGRSAALDPVGGQRRAQSQGWVPCARRVIRCRLTQETRISHAVDDVASMIQLFLVLGAL